MSLLNSTSGVKIVEVYIDFIPSHFFFGGGNQVASV